MPKPTEFEKALKAVEDDLVKGGIEEDEEPEPEPKPEEEEEEEDGKKKKTPVPKQPVKPPIEDEESLKSETMKNLEKSEVLNGGFEVSTFLAELGNQIAAAIDGQGEIMKSEAADLKKGITAMLNLGKSQADLIKAQDDKFDFLKSEMEELKKSPTRQGPKSIVNADQVRGRFPTGARDDDALKNLTKADALDILVKAVADKEVADNDVIRFEAGAGLTPNAFKAIKRHVQEN